MPVSAAERIQAIDRSRHAAMAGSLMLSETIRAENATENLLREAVPGPDLLLPTNYLGQENIIVPSLTVVTPRGREASFVDIHGSNPKLDKLYSAATGNGKKTDQVQRMSFEGLVRILDTSGAEGLHHVHGSDFPGTVFHDTRKATGPTPNIYLTRLGETKGREGSVPVIGLITATSGIKGQLDLIKAIGANGNRQRFKK